MKRLVLAVGMIVTLIGCADKEPEVEVPEAGSEEFSLIEDASDPVAEVERRLQNAILQQRNDAFSFNDITVDELTEEETAENGVLAYYYVENEDTYFTLEDSYEFSLTIVTKEAVDDFGDNLVDFVNIFARTSDPTLDLDEGREVSSYLNNLANSDKNYTFTETKYISFEHSRNGFIAYPETHFTDDFSEETLFYSSLPLSKLPHKR